MTKIWTLITVIGLVGLLSCYHRRLASSEREIVFEPRGYYEIVNKAVLPHLCVARQADLNKPDLCAPFTQNPDPVPDLGQIVLHWKSEFPGKKIPQVYRVFEERSFLRFDRADLRNFDWRIENGTFELRQLRPGLHRQRLPFSEESEWLGSITYGSSSVLPRLVSLEGDQQIVFRPLQDKNDIFPLELHETGKWQRSGIVEWKRLGRSILTAWAYPLGSGPEQRAGVVIRRLPGAEGTVFLNDEAVKEESLRGVENGDWLELHVKGARRRYLLEYEQEGIISAMRLTAEGRRREISEDPAVKSIAVPLAQAMNLAVVDAYQIANKNNNGRDQAQRLQDLHITLTLDKAIHTTAHQSLKQWMNSLRPRAKAPWEFKGGVGTPPRAALLVMDLTSGDVLAAASYPDLEDLATEQQLTREAIKRSAAGGGRQRLLQSHLETLYGRMDYLAQNHNFSHHQSGSVTKPLFALTVAMDPSLEEEVLQKKINCTGNHGRYEAGKRGGRVCRGADPIEGYPLGCFLDKLHGKEVDFPTYLARSCQSFQFHLGARALHRLAGPQVDGQTLCSRAQLGTYSDNPDGNSPFGRWRQYFGVKWQMLDLQEVYKYDRGTWRPVNHEVDLAFAELGCPVDLSSDSEGTKSLAPTVQGGLARLGPSRVYFQGVGFNRCIKDYGSWLKGGGVNRWSNLLIAQALARIATGSRVEAHLVKSGQEKPPSQLEEKNPKRFARVRELILQGMGKVMTDPLGTARDIKTPISHWLKELQNRPSPAYYGVYTKTGSSGRDRWVGWNSTTQKQKRRPFYLQEANFAMIVARCDKPGAIQENSLACSKIPAPGRPWSGVIIYLWVADLGGSERALEFFQKAEGQEVLNEVATYLAQEQKRR